MSCSRPVAVLQIISNHHMLLPARLVRALALLDELDYPYKFYDIERSPELDFRSALVKLFASIKEETVLVSMACNNQYPKIESLIFLFLYLPLLKNKRVIICSPYFSLYQVDLVKRDNVIFCSLDIDDYIASYIGDPDLKDDVFFEHLDQYLVRYGYQDYRFWAYLTFGCRADCSFCYNRLPFKDAPIVSRHCPHTVLSWMRAGRRLGKTYFEFSEPNFLSDRSFASQFLDVLKRENPGVTWRCKTRLDDIDSVIYKRMIDAGCRTIFFGFEHVDEGLLQEIRKGEDSSQKLNEFMSYRREETAIHVSFMTGIRGETPAMLRRNFDMMMGISAFPHVEPNLGWQILFNRLNRVQTFQNVIVAFMHVMNIVPPRMSVSSFLMRDVLSMCLREPFFDFLYLTECEMSLELMQQMVIYFKSHPEQQIVRDYDRLLTYDGGVLVKIILKSRTLNELNNSVLSLMGV